MDRAAPFGRRVAGRLGGGGAAATRHGSRFQVIVDGEQLLIVVRVRMLVAGGLVGIVHAAGGVVGREILVLVAEVVIVADFLAGDELAPGRSVVLRHVEIGV